MEYDAANIMRDISRTPCGIITANVLLKPKTAENLDDDTPKLSPFQKTIAAPYIPKVSVPIMRMLESSSELLHIIEKSNLGGGLIEYIGFL